MRAIYQSLKRVPEAVDGLSTRIVSRSQTNVQKDPSVRTNNLLTSRGSKKVFGTVQKRTFFASPDPNAKETSKSFKRDPPRPLAFEAWISIGNELLEQKRFEEAIECFDKAIATDSRTPIAYNNKASAYIRLKKYDEALECLVTALRLDPYYDRAHTNKGIVFIYQKKIEGALLELKRATELNPKNFDAWNTMATLYMDKKRYTEAKECYAKASELDPSCAQAHFGLGYCLLMLDDGEAGLKAFGRSLELNPKDWKALHIVAMVHNDAGRYVDAINALDTAIAIHANSAEVWACKAKAHYALGHWKQALESYNKELELSSNASKNEDLLLNKAACLFMDRQNDKAIEILVSLLRLNEKNIAAWQLQAKVLKKMQRYAEALQAIEHALILQGERDKSYLLWTDKADMLIKMSQFAEAIEAADHAISMNPNYEYAWATKASAFNHLGKTNEAIALFDRALELQSDDYTIWFNKAFVLYNSGRKAESLKCFKRVLEMLPEEPEALRFAAELSVSLGEYSAGVELYDRLLAVRPNDPEGLKGKSAAMQLANMSDNSGAQMTA
jgi:tetratricopeptide (TPR) repeat protein